MPCIFEICALYFSLLAQSIFRISRIFKNYTRTVNKIMASVNSKMTTFAYRTEVLHPLTVKFEMRNNDTEQTTKYDSREKVIVHVGNLGHCRKLRICHF